jgi:uncharacterized membrane protein YqiK
MKTLKAILSAVLLLCAAVAVGAILVFTWFALVVVLLGGCGIMVAWLAFGKTLYIKNTKTGETFTINRFKKGN